MPADPKFESSALDGSETVQQRDFKGVVVEADTGHCQFEVGYNGRRFKKHFTAGIGRISRGESLDYDADAAQLE